MEANENKIAEVLTEIASVIDRQLHLAGQVQGGVKPGPEAVSAAIRRVLARRLSPTPVFVEE